MSALFLLLYLLSALLQVTSLYLYFSLTLTISLTQVALLLHLASVLVTFMWARAIDPDNAAIPYLTATGDLLGGALLALVFTAVNSLD